VQRSIPRIENDLVHILMELLHLKQNIAPYPLALKVNLEISRDMLTLPRIVVGESIGVSRLVYGSYIACHRPHELCGGSFMHCPTIDDYPIVKKC